MPVVDNMRIDYFARREEAPLFPKVLRNSLMVHNFPNPVLTTVFLAAVIAIFAATPIVAAPIHLKKSLSLRVVVRLLGVFVCTGGLVMQALHFWSDSPYSVARALLNMAISIAGILFTLL